MGKDTTAQKSGITSRKVVDLPAAYEIDSKVVYASSKQKMTVSAAKNLLQIEKVNVERAKRAAKPGAYVASQISGKQTTYNLSYPDEKYDLDNPYWNDAPLKIRLAASRAPSRKAARAVISEYNSSLEKSSKKSKRSTSLKYVPYQALSSMDRVDPDFADMFAYNQKKKKSAQRKDHGPPVELIKQAKKVSSKYKNNRGLGTHREKTQFFEPTGSAIDAYARRQEKSTRREFQREKRSKVKAYYAEQKEERDSFRVRKQEERALKKKLKNAGPVSAESGVDDLTSNAFFDDADSDVSSGFLYDEEDKVDRDEYLDTLGENVSPYILRHVASEDYDPQPESPQFLEAAEAFLFDEKDPSRFDRVSYWFTNCFQKAYEVIFSEEDWTGNVLPVLVTTGMYCSKMRSTNRLSMKLVYTACWYITLPRGVRSLFSLKRVQSLLTGASEGDIPDESVYDGVSSEALSDNARGVLEVLQYTFAGEFLENLRNILVGVFSLELFPKEYYFAARKHLGKLERCSTLEALEKVGESLIFMLSRFELWIAGLPLLEVLTSGDPVKDTIKKISALLTDSENLIPVGKLEGYTSNEDFLLQAVPCISNAEELLDTISKRDRRRDTLEHELHALQRVVTGIQSRLHASNRLTPACIVLVGPPHIGKSQFLRFVHTAYCRVRGWEYDSRMVFNQAYDSPYCDGYIPDITKIFHIGEMASMRGNLAESRGDPIMSIFNSLVDSGPYRLNMAELGNKGSIYANPGLVTGDTNNPTLNADKTHHTPISVLRRPLFVSLEVKDKYKQDGNGVTALDKDKSLVGWQNGDREHFLDIYKIEVYKYIPGNLDNHNIPVKTVLLRTSSISTFENFLLRHFRKHLSDEEQVRMVSERNGYSINEEKFVDDVVAESGAEIVAQSYGRIRPWLSLAYTQLDEAYGEEIRWASYSLLVWFFVTWHFRVNSRFTTAYPNLCATFAVIYSLSLTWFAGRLGWPFLVFSLLHVLYLCVSHRLKLSALATFRMRAESVTARIKYFAYQVTGYAGHAFSSPKLRSRICKVAAMLSITAGFYAMFFKRCKVRAEDKVDYSVTTKDRTDLVETALKCTPGYKRIPNKLEHKIWNEQVTPLKHPHKGSIEELGRYALKNLRHYQIVVHGKLVHSYMLGIRGNFFLMNTHARHGMEDFEIRVSPTLSPSANDLRNTFVITKEDYLDLGDDMTLVSMPIQCRDLLKHFAEGEGFPKASDAIVCEKRTYCHVVASQTVNHNAITKQGTVATKFVVSKCYAFSFPEHAEGHCGLPLIVGTQSGAFVSGIHFAGGSDDLAYATVISRTRLETGIDALSRSTVFPGLFSQSLTMPELETPIERSAFRFEHLQNLSYAGKVPGPVMLNNKSKIVHTRGWETHSKAIKAIFGAKITSLYCPPMMRPTIRNGEYFNPYNIALKKMNRPVRKLNTATLLRVQKEILERLDPLVDEKISPLTVECAINGVEDDPFTRRITASTSAGFGLPGTKGKHLPLEDHFTRMPTEEVMLLVLEAIEKYQDGYCLSPIFVGSCKDEPRLLEKARTGKTRIFYVIPLVYLIVSRMVLSPFYTLLVERGDLVGATVGINAHTGFDALYHSLVDFSPYVFEGDYGGFDVSMPPEVGMCVAGIVSEFVRRCGYSYEAQRVVDGVLSDACFPWVSLCSDVFMRGGLQPSGKYATAEDNCMRNLVIVMYLWYQVCDEPFFENIRLATYGDDLLVAVHENKRHIFNGAVFQSLVKNYMGMEFTSTDKTEVVPEFIPLELMTFLKRRFVKSPFGDMIIAPLEIDSIYKSLIWTIPSEFVSAQDQISSTFASALWEFYFHCKSEDQFESIRDHLSQVLAEFYGVPVGIQSLPTFQDVHKVIFGVKSESGYETVEGYSAWVSGDLPKRGNLSIARGPYAGSLVRTNKHAKFQYEEKFLEEVRDTVPKGCPACLRGDSSAHRLFEDIPSGSLEDMLEGYLSIRTHCAAWLKKNARGQVTPRVARIRRSRSQPVSEDVGVQKVYQRLADVNATIMVIKRRLELSGKEYDIQVYAESGVFDASAGALDETKVIENFEDSPGDGYDDVTGGKSKPLSQGEASFLSIANFLSRPIEIASFSITPGTNVNSEFPIWDLWSLNPTIRSKLRNFNSLRCDLKVMISISGTPFHYGRVLVSYQPYPLHNTCLSEHSASLAFDATWRPLMLNYLSQAPGAATIDVKANKPLTVHCPFISPKPFYRLWNSSTSALSDVTSFADFENAGTLYFYSINPVSAVTSGVPSELYVQIIAWAEDVELGIPTASQTVVTTESGVDEREVGPVEHFATKAADIVSKFTSIPWLRPYALASTIAFGAAARVSAIFGWSKPVVEKDYMLVKNQPFANGAQCIGWETCKRICVDPKQELTIDSSACGTEADDMAITCISSRCTYLTTFTWDNAANPLVAPMFKCKVNPLLETVHVGAFTSYQPTALAFAALPFFYWRGDLIFRFEIVCSAYHRGKILFYYEPNIYQHALIDADLSTNKQFTHVIDIQQTQCVEFCVNWGFHRAWAQTGRLQKITNIGVTGVTDADSYCNGYIGVAPFTRLQSPDDSDVQVNVYVYSNNLLVNQPGVSLPTSRETIYAESGVDIAGEPVSCVELNPSTADVSHVSELHFGEGIPSFRLLMKRFTTNYREAFGDPTSNYLNFQMVAPIVPPIEPAFGTATVFTPTLLSYLRYAYLGLRGGMRKRLRFYTVTHSTATSLRTAISLVQPEDAAAQVYTGAFTSDSVWSFLTGTVNFVPSTNAGIEVELPCYTNNLFLYSFCDDLTGINNTGEVEDTFTRRYRFVTETHSSGSTSNKFYEETAAGEDFTLMRFCGAPFYKSY